MSGRIADALARLAEIERTLDYLQAERAKLMQSLGMVKQVVETTEGRLVQKPPGRDLYTPRPQTAAAKLLEQCNGKWLSVRDLVALNPRMSADSMRSILSYLWKQGRLIRRGDNNKRFEYKAILFCGECGSPDKHHRGDCSQRRPEDDDDGPEPVFTTVEDEELDPAGTGL